MIKKIKEIIEGQDIKYSMDSNEKHIISALSVSEMSDESIEAHINNYIAKGKISEDSILGAAKKMVKIANRKMYSFDSIEEVQKFAAKNECGRFWDDFSDNKPYHIYKY